MRFRGFFFIDNSNITLSDLNDDGIHLNPSGTFKIKVNLLKTCESFNPFYVTFIFFCDDQFWIYTQGTDTDTKVDAVSLVSEINSNIREIEIDNPTTQYINDINDTDFDPWDGIFSDTDNHVSNLFVIKTTKTLPIYQSSTKIKYS